MPIRRDGDKREQISDWDSWVDKEINDARARGEFDNLATQGKPIDLYSTNVNQQWDFAFSRMKNTDTVPAWMELDRDCHALRVELDTFLVRSARYLEAQLRLLSRPGPQHEHPTTVEDAAPWWKVWQHLATWLALPGKNVEEPPLDRLDLIRIRRHMLEQYLERAAALDKAIVEFDEVLPRTLMHLERMRMLPARAKRLFDAGCPPIP